MKRSNKFMCNYWPIFALISAPLWALLPCALHAGPNGEHIVGGSGSIVRPNNQLTEIHQNSDRLAIDWQRFDVDADEVVRFVQPSSRSMALNRIFDSKQSLILGRIEANGHIFLINPRGIIFGKDATINVAGLIASSLDIDPDHFINGNFTFTDKGGDGVIVNQGTIEAAVGGAVVLLGKVVINEGEIQAPHGSAQLVSAGGAVISFDDNEQLGIQITAEQQQKIADQNDAVRNNGNISAEGGYIALNGVTTADLFTNAVNNEGVLVASSVSHRGGVIELKGDDIRNTGTIAADGTSGGTIRLHADDLILAKNDSIISATGSDGVGGRIELLGDRVGVINQSRIDASGKSGGGVVRVGGEFQGQGSRNAQRTVVGNDATIHADATQNGNGGEVVLWSDDVTYFGGKIFARGGSNGGDGGIVEVSGKRSLDFRGFVDTSAPRGKMGNLLLDPAIINIINGSSGTQDGGIADGIILSGDSPSPYQISEQALEALTSNVTLTATQQINIGNLADNQLLFNPSGGTVTFNVNGTNGASLFTMADTNDEIRVNNGSLTINVINNVSGVGASTAGATTITLGNLTTTSGSVSVQGSSSANSSTTGATTGNVIISMGTVNAGTGVTVSGATSAISTPSTANAGAVTVTTGNITAGGNVSLTGTTTGDNSSGSSATAGNVSVTSGTISTSGTVSASTSSNTSPAAAGTATSGSAATTVGDIVAGGAVTLSSSSTASNGLGTQNGNSTTVTAADISITGNAPLQITTTSSGTGNTQRQVNLGGNYIANGGNETLNTYTLNLTSNAVFNTTGTISLNYTNLVTNGFTLTQGAITNIYVGDISSSAGAGELGFSQTDIDVFAGTGLVLNATNNIFLGTATITSPSATSVQLIADSDSSGGGDISIASGRTFNLNGRNLVASGANATINGNITNSGNGSQEITTTRAINFGSGSSLTSSGNIALNAGTGITMASNASITSTTGQLALTAANNIALGSLSSGNATTSAVNITSSAGSISNAGAATNIFAIATGSRATLNAASGINTALSIADLSLTNSSSGAVTLSNNRALQISSFTNTPATTASITTTGGASDLTIAGNMSSGSNLTLTSSGALAVNSGSTMNSNAGTLAINAAGNAAITGLTTTNSTASAIAVTSGGAITDNGNATNDITATQATAVVTLQAANGIGAANALDLSIANLTLTNSTSGAVDITNNRALQIDSLTNTPAANTTVTTTGVGSNMTLVGNVTSGGNLALISSGTFAATDGFTVNSNAGTLAINSTGDAAITGLTTTNNTSSAVSVISSGAITDSGDTSADITAIQPNAVVTLQTASGIGNGNPLDINTASIAATNGSSGDIRLHALGSYTFTAIDNSASPAGALVLNADGNLIVNNISAANGVIILSAFDNVGLGSGATLQSTGGTISVTADSNANGVGSIAMGNGTIDAASGTITLNASQDISLNQLTTTNATTNAVSITSTAGGIVGNADGIADITATNTGGLVTLNAATGINAGASPLELSIANLTIANSTSGAINLTNNRALQISSFANNANSNIVIVVTGTGNDLTLSNTLQNNGGDTTLTAAGNIGLENIANVASLNTSSATVNYAQSTSAASITSAGIATVAGNLTATNGNIDLQTVALGAGAHSFSAQSGNINLGAVTGNSSLQLSSGANIALTSASLGVGSFIASSTANGIFTANGDINAAAVSINQFSIINLRRIVAGNTLNISTNTINLFDDLSSNGAMTLTGTTQLQNDIFLSTTSSGGLLQLAGSVVGNNHVLTIAAANNTVCIACISGASAAGLSALEIQSSVKSALGTTTVNGDATINADQEIYLNDDISITGNLALLADANNDGIGIAALLAGKQLNVSGSLTTQPTALTSITTAELCAIPMGLPQMPTTPPIPPTTPPTNPTPTEDLSDSLIRDNVTVALQESGKYARAISDAMLHNAPQITYLNNSCQSNSSSQKGSKSCDVDASMLDFLGTFLIDNQIPKAGNMQ